MSTSRQRSSSSSSSSAKHNGKVAASSQIAASLPAPDDRDGWRAHWQTQGQLWRTEPEIDQKRQKELTQYRAIVPDSEKGIYPFKERKLNRADVEWLLATHENGRGPVDWNDRDQRDRSGLDLRGANLSEVDLSRLPLTRIRSGLTNDERARTTRSQHFLAAIHLEKANLFQTHLEGAILRNAHLESAHLESTYLENADCVAAHFEGAYLRKTHFDNAYLRRAFFDNSTFIEDISLGNETIGFASLADIRWNGVNLSPIKWQQVKTLGDTEKAKKDKSKRDNEDARLLDYEAAVRANRQLTIVLQEQGLNEHATRFSYEAQSLQRGVLWLQMLQPRLKLSQRLQLLMAWLLSWFLFLLAGYGYKPGKSFLAYFFVISGFATAYYLLGHTVGPMLSPLGAFVFSMTSFHGRGFFPGNNISLDDPLTVLAAFEALVGLIIEVTFIATLTQRFFNR